MKARVCIWPAEMAGSTPRENPCPTGSGSLGVWTRYGAPYQREEAYPEFADVLFFWTLEQSFNPPGQTQCLESKRQATFSKCRHASFVLP